MRCILYNQFSIRIHVNIDSFILDVHLILRCKLYTYFSVHIYTIIKNSFLGVFLILEMYFTYLFLCTYVLIQFRYMSINGNLFVVQYIRMLGVTFLITPLFGCIVYVMGEYYLFISSPILGVRCRSKDIYIIIPLCHAYIIYDCIYDWSKTKP